MDDLQEPQLPELRKGEKKSNVELNKTSSTKLTNYFCEKDRENEKKKN